MIFYILQKGYTTKNVKGIDELNALSLKGWDFVRAIEQPEPVKSEPEGKTEEPVKEKEEFVCGKCGKVYKTKKRFLNHIETCEG